jgi:raffinose/stachyose/melibiose transport system permease protein
VLRLARLLAANLVPEALVPMIIPGLAALFILGFIGTWNEYAVASVILKRPDLFPVMVGAKTLVDPDAQDLQLMASLCVMNVVPLIVIFTFVQRYLVSGLTMGSIK